MSPTNPTFIPPRCVFVTGPRSQARAHWIEERVAHIHAAQPERRCSVLLADERLTRTQRFADYTPRVEVRCVFMPCLCCPASADLSRLARRFAETTRPDWLFIEVPAIAAAGLIAEFDHVVRWPREVLVGLSREWAQARRAQTLSLFQTRLLALADHVIEPPTNRTDEATPPAVPSLSLI